MLPDVQILFAQKLPDLAPVLNKLLRFKRITDWHSHQTVHASSHWAIFAILQQKSSDFNHILHFLKPYE